MPVRVMQIVCPNCATAYEIPDSVFNGRARKLRCENCGTQWRAGPPGAEGLEPASPQAPPPAAPEAGRVFGKPVDAAARAEFEQAMGREAQEHSPNGGNGGNGNTPQPPPSPSEDASNEADDPFINLVMAARSRSIEFEPEPPPPPRRISSPILVGGLLAAFVIVVAYLLLHAR